MPLTQHLMPRAGIDPIDGAGPALAMFDVLLDRPVRDQTLVLLLDAHRRGLGALVVDGTGQPERVLDVAEMVALAAPQHPELQAVVLASVRTVGPSPGLHDCTDDIDRWLDLSDVFDQAGLELLEWFVVRPNSSWCPRDLLGEPPRW